MTKYDFTVIPADVGVNITLTRLADGVERKFYQASGTVEGMSHHMNSLTDLCCDDMFPKARKPNKQ